MNQLFVTLRDAERCAADCLRLIDNITDADIRGRKWRPKLEHVRDLLRDTVVRYEATDWIDDDGGPYLHLFDALSYLTQVTGSWNYDARAVSCARDLLVSIAR